MRSVLPEPIAAQLAVEVARSATARIESSATVRAELDAEIRRICGDARIGLDKRVAAAVALSEQLVRFETDGTDTDALPGDAILDRHRKRVEAARAGCEAAFDRIAEELLASNLELARTVVAEKHRALARRAPTPSPAPPPDVVALSATVLADDALPEPLPEPLLGRSETIRAAAAVLVPARAEHRQAIERARKPVLEEFVQIEKRLAANKKLSPRCAQLP